MLISELMANVFSLLLLRITLSVQEIREEKQLDDDKEDEQLDADDDPQRLAHSHAAKSIVIQMENARPEALFTLLVLTHNRKVSVLNNLQN